MAKTTHTLPEALKTKVKDLAAKVQSLRVDAQSKEENLVDMVNAYLLGAGLQGKVTINADFDLEVEEPEVEEAEAIEETPTKPKA